MQAILISKSVLPSSPSRTALSVALRRAAHQLHDRPLVFPDPLAIPICGPEYAARIRIVPARSSSVALRAFLVARSRYAEDALHLSHAQGTRQYVILGAGLDTFAYRNPYSNLRVFEVDHPDTQAWKRSLLAQAAISIPGSLSLVAADLERQALLPTLHQAGFNPAAPTFVSWLGVVLYLTLAAFRQTVTLLAGLPHGSAVSLDYGQPRSVLSPLEQLAHDSLSARVQARGEPFRLFFTPAEMASELTAFTTLEDIGRDEINTRYFQGRTDLLRIRGQAGRFLTAWL